MLEKPDLRDPVPIAVEHDLDLQARGEQGDGLARLREQHLLLLLGII